MVLLNIFNYNGTIVFVLFADLLVIVNFWEAWTGYNVAWALDKFTFQLKFTKKIYRLSFFFLTMIFFFVHFLKIVSDDDFT